MPNGLYFFSTHIVKYNGCPPNKHFIVFQKENDPEVSLNNVSSKMTPNIPTFKESPTIRRRKYQCLEATKESV